MGKDTTLFKGRDIILWGITVGTVTHTHPTRLMMVLPDNFLMVPKLYAFSRNFILSFQFLSLPRLVMCDTILSKHWAVATDACQPHGQKANS